MAIRKPQQKSARPVPQVEESIIQSISKSLAQYWMNLNMSANKVVVLARKRLKKILIELLNRNSATKNLGKPQKFPLATMIIDRLKQLGHLMMEKSYLTPKPAFFEASF